MFNFGTKIVIFEISTLKSVKSEFLTIKVNFCIWPAFSKGPGRDRVCFTEYVFSNKVGIFFRQHLGCHEVASSASYAASLFIF